MHDAVKVGDRILIPGTGERPWRVTVFEDGVHLVARFDPDMGEFGGLERGEFRGRGWTEGYTVLPPDGVSFVPGVTTASGVNDEWFAPVSV